jgi:hypothetical protein
VTAVVGEAAGGDRQRRWWLAVAAAALVFFFSLSPLFFVLFFLSVFSAFPLLLSLFYYPLLLTCFPSLFFHLFCPHVFIGKNRGGTWLGRPLCRRPSTAPPTRGKFFFGQVGLVDVFLREKWWWKTEKEKSSSSLASRVQGKKKTHRAVQNGIVWVFSFFFREQCMKRSGFGQNAPFHLKGKRRQKCVRVHIDPQFVICSIKS